MSSLTFLLIIFKIPLFKPKAEKSKPTEIKRTTRTRDDGTSYHEVEFSDGSMETIDIKSGE